jgi:hypothetical protein
MIVNAAVEVAAGRAVRDPEELDPLTLASSAFRIRWQGKVVCMITPTHICDDSYDCRNCSVADRRAR